MFGRREKAVAAQVGLAVLMMGFALGQIVEHQNIRSARKRFDECVAITEECISDLTECRSEPRAIR